MTTLSARKPQKTAYSGFVNEAPPLYFRGRDA